MEISEIVQESKKKLPKFDNSNQSLEIQVISDTETESMDVHAEK